MPTKDPEARRRHSATYYAKNRAKVRAINDATRARNKAEVQDLIWTHLASHPCVDCGEADPLVLEFDHRDPDTKDFNIGAAVGGTNYAGDVRLEIAKCDVRCANCHRRRTAEVGNHWRWLRTLE